VIRSDIRPHASGLGVTTSAARLVQIMVTPHGAEGAALPALSPPRSARLSPKPGRAPYQFRMIQVCPKDLPAAPRLR
jgi:hypothetical protein